MPRLAARARPGRRRAGADPFRAHRHGRRDLPRRRRASSRCRRRRPTVRTATDVAEAFLGRLDGSAFDAPTRLAGDVATRIERWGRSVTGERGRLIVRLDPPDDANVWHLAVFAPGNRGEPLPIEQAIVERGRRPPAPRRRDHPARTHAPGAAPAGRHPARRGDPEPGRSLGPHGDHRAATRGRRLRRAGARAVARANPRRRCACSSTRPRSRRSARTSSPTCAGRRCSTTSSSPRPTSPGSHTRRARSSARVGGGSRSTRPTCRPRPTRSPNGRRRRSSPARRCCASRSVSKAPRSRAASRSSAAVGPPSCSRPRPRCRRRPRARPTASSASCAATRPRRSRGSASSPRPGSAAASRSTWVSARRPRCSPTSSPARARARRS